MHWISKLAPIVGYIIGIGLVAVGLVMLLQGVVKLIVPAPETSYVEDQCRSEFTVERADSGFLSIYENIEDCIKTRERQEFARANRQAVELIVTAIPQLIVGGIFWFIFRRRNDK